MKNIKLVAKIMILVLLFYSTIVLNSCSYIRLRQMDFNSHKEFVEFLKTYNSKHDKNVSTFISFNFDDDDTIEKSYHVHLRLIVPTYIDDAEYDKYTDYIGITMSFYLDDFDTNNQCQIVCTYYNESETMNLKDSDTITVTHIRSYSLNNFVEDDLYPTYNNYKQDFADLRTYNNETNEYDKYYNFLYIYQLKANETNNVSVRINSQIELEQESLQKIGQLLLDNIVIINTEG